MSDRISGAFPGDRSERSGGRPERAGYSRDRGGRPGARPAGPRPGTDRDRRAPRRSDRDGDSSTPRIPDSITEDDLSRDAKAELRGLPADLAATVGRLLVAAELASDPEQGYRYAQAARRMAARIGVVREVTGITAYQTGRWAEALAELRAARRLTGRSEYLPLMADSERALGRLDQALELVQSDEAKRLPRASQIELRIVESGIRRDQGLADAAVLALQVPELTDGRLRPYSARLFYAYGDALLAAGRPEAAREAFSRAVVADEDEETDALARLDDLDGITLEDLEEEPDSDDEDAQADDLDDDAEADDLDDDEDDDAADDLEDDADLDEDDADLDGSDDVDDENDEADDEAEDDADDEDDSDLDDEAEDDLIDEDDADDDEGLDEADDLDDEDEEAALDDDIYGEDLEGEAEDPDDDAGDEDDDDLGDDDLGNEDDDLDDEDADA
jgi:predicted negative regulator of RcsB-dependent stress response